MKEGELRPRGLSHLLLSSLFLRPSRASSREKKASCGPGLKGRVGFRPTATGLEAAFLPFSFKEKGPPRALPQLLLLLYVEEEGGRDGVSWRALKARAEGCSLRPPGHLFFSFVSFLFKRKRQKRARQRVTRNLNGHDVLLAVDSLLLFLLFVFIKKRGRKERNKQLPVSSSFSLFLLMKKEKEEGTVGSCLRPVVTPFS